MSCVKNVMNRESHVWRLSCVKNVMFAECHVWRMSCIENVMYEECHVWKMSCVKNVMCEECHVWRCHVWRMSCVKNVMCEECHVWRMSCVKNVMCEPCLKIKFKSPERRGWVRSDRFGCIRSGEVCRIRCRCHSLPASATSDGNAGGMLRGVWYRTDSDPSMNSPRLDTYSTITTTNYLILLHWTISEKSCNLIEFIYVVLYIHTNWMT